jgi:hypothetical protein
MPKLEQRFDYVKIGIASPERIRQWGERTLPNGMVVGEVTKPETINYGRLSLKWMACFANAFLALQRIGNAIAVNTSGFVIGALFVSVAV